MRRAIPLQMVAVVGPLLVGSLLIGVGSALALRPAALVPSAVGASWSPSPSPSVSPSSSPTAYPSPGPSVSPGASRGGGLATGFRI
jgi:hypothetical protein